MMEQYTNAEEMARQAGLSDGKKFRGRLRKRHPELHTRGSWSVVIGEPKHQAMEAELALMLAEVGSRP